MNKNITSKIEENGFYYEDDFLDKNIFDKLNEKIIKSFMMEKNWKTRIKKNSNIYSCPMLKQDKILELSREIKHYTNSNSFNYLYNSLHQDDDNNDLINGIVEIIIKEWESKGFIFNNINDKNFSLTCFNSGTFLDWHTDYSNDLLKSYKYTLLLYFGIDREFSSSEFLNFKYRNKINLIEPKPNRALIFIPNIESLHGVFPNTSEINLHSYDRLALSGWLI